MKVIGIGEDRNTYICEVDHTELEKFTDLYYGNMERMVPGDEIDLRKGYDYASDIRSALRKIQGLFEANKDILKALTNGFLVKQRSE